MFAYRLGDFILVGPEPTPHDEMVFMLANEGTKAPETLANAIFARDR
jgi:hypothetical protein